MSEATAEAVEATPESTPEQDAPEAKPASLMGEATDAPEAQETGEVKPWGWTDENAGEGERPEWLAEKFNTVEAQAKAYKELEKLHGKHAGSDLLGAPEGGEYVLPDAPEGTIGEYQSDDPMINALTGACAELGLSQRVYDTILQAGAKAIAEANAETEAEVAKQLGELGPNIESRIEQMKTYIVQSQGADAYNALSQTVGADPAAYTALEKLVQSAMNGAQLAGNEAGGGGMLSRSDVEAEQYKLFPEGHPKAGQSMYENDAEHRKYVDGLWKKLAPGMDRRIVG